METDPLYFKSMTIQNIRCFGDTPQTLDLTDDKGKPAKWNLILGDNGVGKTTLLECMVGPITLLDRILAAPPKSFKSSPIKSKLWIALRLQLIESSFDGALKDTLSRFPNTRIRHELNNLNLTSQVNFEYNQSGVDGDISEFDIDHLPLAWAYGPDRNQAINSASASFPKRVFNPSFPELVNVRAWLRGLDYSSSKASDIQRLLKQRLENVRSLLIDILPDVDDIRITAPTKDAPEPDVEFLTPYGWVELKDVAYGYQSLVSWVVDFAYRLTERYPDSENPLAEPAICLIDELALHLHPSWQRDVMGYLSEKFPNTQFIATVHSPLVVQAAPTVNANVAVLRRVSGEPYDHVVIDNDPEIIRSWRLDQLLASDLFATTRGPISPRNPDVQAKIDERRQILAKGEITTNDKKRLGEITKEIDMVPVSETSEQIRAQELLSESYKLLSKEKAEQ